MELLKTICGIEIMHMISKGQVEEIQCVLFEVGMSLYRFPHGRARVVVE